MQSKQAKSLQTIYSTQAEIGFIVTFLGTLLVAAMSTDTQSISSASAFWSTVLVFTVLFIVTISLPKAAFKELEDYKNGGKLYYNMLDALLITILFLPLGFWQFYLLIRAHKTSGNKKKKKIENPVMDTIDLDKYIEEKFREIGSTLATY